jgi:SNF2 family DNA or RNA helicase
MRPVALSKEGGFAVIRAPYLGGVRFDEYRKAVEGARYDWNRKANVATIDKLPGILRRLREMDLCVDLSQDLVEALEEHDAQLWLDVQGARERVERFDQELRKSGKSLYPFQATGAVWLAPRHGALLGDQMGMGKTATTIASLPASASVLVVCPASVKGVWRGEVAKFRPGLRTALLSGRGSFRWPEKGEVVVVNYDVLPETHDKACLVRRKDKLTKVAGRHTDSCERARQDPVPHRLAAECTGCYPLYKVARECRGCLPFLKEVPREMVLVFDEAHKLKNANAQRTVKARGLSWATREAEGRVWLLSGTPLQNEPMELWAVLHAAQLAEEVFGNFKAFLRMFGGRAEEHGYSFSGDVEGEEVRERLERVMLRRLKEDVLSELPRMTVQHVEVDVDRKTVATCEAVLAACGGVEAVLKDLDKAVSFENMAQARVALARAKVPALLEMVESYEEASEPLVVFSAHRAPIDLLGEREGWATITGDTSVEKRDEIVRLFQEGRFLGIALTIRAGGEGITLTRASNMVFVDEEWSPAVNAQARDRCLRIGQTKPVLVKILVADHELDRRVAETLTRKAKLIQEALDGPTRAARKESEPEGRDERAEDI